MWSARERHGRRWKIALLVVAALLGTLGAITSASAQPNVPTDMALETKINAIRELLPTAPLLGPTLLPFVQATLHFQQSMLCCYKLQVDDALLTAWTTHTLLDIDKSLHQSIAAAKHIIQKLERDIAWYEDKYSRFTSPVFQAETSAEGRRYEKYQALKSFVAEYKPRIEAAGQNVMNVFAEIRQRINRGAYGNPSMRLDSARIATTLLAFQEEISAVEKAIDEKIYQPRVTPLRQIRLRFANDSPNLVFFVRISERDASGQYPTVRPDTKEWVPIHPKGNAVTISGPSGDQDVVTLPNETWLPAKLLDQVELRVATMGDVRQRIRFMQLPMSGQVRPDLQSLSRGFYFFAYEVPQAYGKIVSHWYPTSETYKWYFTGGWGAALPEYVPTDVSELKEDTRYDLSLTQDHVSWHVPGFLETITDDPECRAQVSGSANFQKKGPTSTNITDFAESGSGNLTITMELW